MFAPVFVLRSHLVAGDRGRPWATAMCPMCYAIVIRVELGRVCVRSNVSLCRGVLWRACSVGRVWCLCTVGIGRRHVIWVVCVVLDVSYRVMSRHVAARRVMSRHVMSSCCYESLTTVVDKSLHHIR